MKARQFLKNNPPKFGPLEEQDYEYIAEVCEAYHAAGSQAGNADLRNQIAALQKLLTIWIAMAKEANKLLEKAERERDQVREALQAARTCRCGHPTEHHKCVIFDCACPYFEAVVPPSEGAPPSHSSDKVTCAICGRVDNVHKPNGMADDGSHAFLSRAEAQRANTMVSEDAPATPHYSTNLAPVYLAEQIFFHVLLRGGKGNPFHAMSNKWFVDLAAPKIRELLTAVQPHFQVVLNDEEHRIVRSLIQKAQGHNLPIAWDNSKVKAVIEKIMPTTYSTVQGCRACCPAARSENPCHRSPSAVREVRRGFGEVTMSSLGPGQFVTASGRLDGGYIVWEEAGLAAETAPKEK